MRKDNWILHLLISFVLHPCDGSSKSVEETFIEGNNFYAEADTYQNKSDLKMAEEGFRKALNSYQACLMKAESSALHYNLGNTYFKLGEIGFAIYHFKQALLIDPSSEEIKANLHLAEHTANIPIRSDKWFERILVQCTPDKWKWLLYFGVWVGLALMIIPRYFGNNRLILPFFGTALVISSIIPAIAIYNAASNNDVGIILKNDTPILVSPTNHSAISKYLKAGTSISIGENENARYIFANTGSGDSGWIDIENIGRLHQ